MFLLILGAFLRVYNIGINYYFSGELGKELLYIRQYFLQGTPPLTGMATSHEWLSYGPFYYWIVTPFFALTGGDPFILFWVALGVSLIGLVLNYIIIKKIINERIAIVAMAIQAISPLLVWQTQNAKLHTFFFILSPLFMYLLYLIWQGKKKWVFWAGLTFGLMFSFHFSQIPLLGVVFFLFWIKKDMYKVSDWLKFILGVLVPNITLIWQDRNIILWLPYRVLKFAGDNLQGTANSQIEYFGRNIFWNRGLWVLGLGIFVAVFVHFVWVNRKNIKTKFLPFYLTSSIGLVVLANLLHGTPPVHYFLPIFTTVPILFAVYVDKYKYPLALLSLFFLLNLNLYFRFQKPDDYIAYDKQTAIASFVVAEARGAPFGIERTGPYDYFPEQYSQNYKYLILWKGGNLVEKSGNVYRIVERQGDVYVQK